MSRACFVVGTDTGVGKTAITAALVEAARARGLVAVGMKPAESGCERVDGQLVPADARTLLRAAGMRHRLEDVCAYRFEAAVAPGVAAQREGVRIDFDAIGALVDQRLREGPDLLVVEGAGGLLVPMGGNRTIADLVVALGLPALVVGRAGLGTINHTLLTIEGLRRREIAIAAVVLVATEPAEADFLASNVAEIEQAGGVEVAGVAPYLAEFEPAGLAGWVDRHLLDRLL